MQGEREADRPLDVVTNRRSPGSQPTVEIVVRRWVIPTSAGATRRQDGVRIQERLAHAHVHGVVHRSARRKWRAWSRISEAVRFRPNCIAPVAQNVHVSGHPDCEERQASGGRPGTASAPSRRDARRASERASSACRRVTSRSVTTSSVENGTSSASAGAGLRQRRHLLVRRRAARRPLPDLARPIGGLAEVGERAVEKREIHVVTVASLPRWTWSIFARTRSRSPRTGCAPRSPRRR